MQIDIKKIRENVDKKTIFLYNINKIEASVYDFKIIVSFKSGYSYLYNTET